MAIIQNKSRFFKPFRNIFVIIFVVFAVWMLFFDTNSWFIHNELNNDIEALENEKEFYKKEIEKDKKEVKKLSNDKGVEKYGREKYHMKKKDEEIYLIEYEDSLKKKKNE